MTTPTRSVALVGDIYRILASGDETDGRYALCEAIVFPGGGPPPHVHTREVEAFYVLDGAVSVFVGEERHVVNAGGFFHVPIGTVHRFQNQTGRPARMLVLVAPAGLERMFLEVGQPVASDAQSAPPPAADEITRLLAAAPKYGIKFERP